MEKKKTSRGKRIKDDSNGCSREHICIDHLHSSDVISNIYSIDQSYWDTQGDDDTSNKEINLVHLDSAQEETNFQMHCN